MKKGLLVLCIALIGCLFTTAQITDTIVSLTPSNRNVVLEEFTGVNCQYCPCGHKIANQLYAAHPDRVCLINVHTGPYAAKYTTEYGEALANQSGLTGYPSGTVNRHVFSGNKTALSQDRFNIYANQLLNMSSPVNIAAEGTLDWETKKLTLRVQLYYTAEQTVSSNLLNIAITQDNVIGPQVINSQSCSYPEMMVGTQYRHMHMLRHLINGQWGESITTIAPGTLVEKTYEYTIPALLGTNGAIAAKFEDLRFVAFVAEGHQEIITGVNIPVEIVNRPELSARLLSYAENQSKNCDGVSIVTLTFENSSIEDTLTSMEYTYSIGDEIHTGSWQGMLAPQVSSSTIVLDTINFPISQDNTLSFQFTSFNGNPVDLSPETFNIRKDVYSIGGFVYLRIVTDVYGDETTFRLYGPNGNVVLSGGPFKKLNAYGTTVNEFTYKPTQIGCYRLEVYDSYGDGMNNGYGDGYFELWNANSDVVYHNDGKIGSKATVYIYVTEPYAVDDLEKEVLFVYPNPATENITIGGVDNIIRAEIFNLQGQLVKVETEKTEINVKDLSNGMYMMKVTTKNGSSMHKIVKK